MRKLTRLWQAFENIPGLLATSAHWRQYAGQDFPVIQPFLRPTDMMGAALPCLDCRVPGCSREIIDCGGGEIVAVCRHPWDRRSDIRIEAADAVLHTVDMAALSKAIAPKLGFRSQTPVLRDHGAWGIGLLSAGYGIDQQVVLMAHSEQVRFRQSLNRLVNELRENFIVLSPTTRRKDLEVHETLSRHHVRFHALEEHLGADEAGQLAAVHPLSADGGAEIPVTPVPERDARIKAFLARHAMTIKEMVVALSLDYRDFKRWRKGELPDSSSKSKKIEAYLHAGPGAPAKR